jgi:multidrug efflux pump subunit AcrA (membrane-fusion protein)
MRDAFTARTGQAQQDGDRTMNGPPQGESRGAANDPGRTQLQGGPPQGGPSPQGNMIAGTAPQSVRTVAAASTPQSRSNNNRFGITQTYPQYQKSSVLPTEEFNRGRVWIKNSTGKLEPVTVRTGLNDGQFTEIITDNLKSGDEIITGVISNSPTKTAAQGNPLMGGPQQGPGGARFGGGPR